MKKDARQSFRKILLATWALMLLPILLSSCGNSNNPSGVLSGQIIREGSEDSEGIQVYLPGTTYLALTDSQGRFRIGQVESGEYTLVAKYPGYVEIREPGIEVSGKVQLRAMTLHLQSDTRNLGSIEGVLTLEGQQDSSGILITLDEAGFATKTDETGLFIIPEVPEGEHSLSASKPEYVGIDNLRINVYAGEKTVLSPAELETVKPTPSDYGVVTGSVTTRSGEPIGGVMVAMPRASFYNTTDSSGEYQFSQVPGGLMDLLFIGSGFLSKTIADIEVTAGETTQVPPVALDPIESAPRTGSIAGMVGLADASDFSGILVSIQGQSVMAMTGSDGRYLLSGVLPGYYDLNVSKPGYERMNIFGVAVDPGVTSPAPSVFLSALTSQEDQISDLAVIQGNAYLEGQVEHSGIMVGLAGTDKFALTSFDGSYTLNEVEPGGYEIIASKNGYESAQSGIIDVPAYGIVSAPDLDLLKQVERPEVVSTNPEDGATGVMVAEDTRIFVRFSQLMDGRSVKSSVTVSPDTDMQLFFGGESQLSDHDLLYIRLLRKRTKRPVLFDTEYTVTISEDAMTKEGVYMEEPYEFKFTTGGAMITGTEPNDGEDNVFWTPQSRIEIYFNTSVDLESFEDSLKIRPAPRSRPSVVPRFFPWGDVASLEMELEMGEEYTVTVDRDLRTTYNERFENTPYRFTFSTIDWDDVDTIEDRLDQQEDYIKSRRRGR